MALAPRPYTVSSAYARKRTMIALGLALAGVAMMVGGGVFIAYQANKLAADQKLWATGVYAEDSHVSGRETSHSAIINDYDLTTSYTDREGHAHSGKVSFALLFSGISSGSRVELKYDPQHPDQHTVSWAVEHTGARWGFILFMGGGLGFLFGGALVAGARQQLRLLADARRVAARSDEVALEVVSISPLMSGRRHIANVYRYKHTVHGHSKELKQQLPPTDEPMFTSEARTHLVALVSPEIPERPWIMRASKAPFDNA